jgi:rhodanese-related sulfurtransferase
MNEIPGRLPELPQDRPVACLCHHGARSQRVAMFLAQNGFSRVANVAGGIDAWSRSATRRCRGTELSIRARTDNDSQE